MSLTTDPNDPHLGHGVDNTTRPQQEVYLVLSEEERAKGFRRPVRLTYRHVGPPGPRYPLRELTPEEQMTHASTGYVQYERYPESEAPRLGRYWTQVQLDAVSKGCLVETHMGRELAETYARDPRFYGATYCAGCRRHRPVGGGRRVCLAGRDEGRHMKLKIISDGTLMGSRVVCAETGESVENVAVIDIHISPKDGVKAKLKCIALEVDVIADLPGWDAR